MMRCGLIKPRAGRGGGGGGCTSPLSLIACYHGVGCGRPYDMFVTCFFFFYMQSVVSVSCVSTTPILVATCMPFSFCPFF